MGQNLFLLKGKRLHTIGNENSSMRRGDANFQADKSLTETGQKTAGELKSTGQKMEMVRKLFNEKNLNCVIFSNGRAIESRRPGRKTIISGYK